MHNLLVVSDANYSSTESHQLSLLRLGRNPKPWQTQCWPSCGEAHSLGLCRRWWRVRWCHFVEVTIVMSANIKASLPATREPTSGNLSYGYIRSVNHTRTSVITALFVVVKDRTWPCVWNRGWMDKSGTGTQWKEETPHGRVCRALQDVTVMWVRDKSEAQNK